MCTKLIKTYFGSLLDLFFPHRCLNCSCIIEEELSFCLNCKFKFDYTFFEFTSKNPMALQLNELCNVHNAIALLQFKRGNLTQKILHQIKYRNKPEIGIYFANQIVSYLPKNPNYCVIPVPIHKKKLKSRGYNQMELFAKTISNCLNADYFNECLIRIKNNPSQTFKNRNERLKSLKDSFEVRKPQLFKGRHILLVDDVMTTGATLSICVNLLNKYSENPISVVTIAYV